VNQYEEYKEILERLHQGQRFLDLGCCFGQEIRQIAADGAPTENIYGCDLEAKFLELGYKLFRDREHLKARFLSADIFDKASPLSELAGTLDMVYAGSFFHLFNYDGQFTAAKIAATLLRPQKGSMLFGRQTASGKANEETHIADPTKTMFQHDVESFKSMWADIGDDLGAGFHVEATLSVPRTAGPQGYSQSDTKWIHFVVRRE
jgi:SAM-dependent methyltransferase